MVRQVSNTQNANPGSVGRSLLSRCAVATLRTLGRSCAHGANSWLWNQLTEPQNSVAKKGQVVQAGIILGQKGRPLYEVVRWPRNRVFLMYYTKGVVIAFGTEVSVRYRE